MVSWVMYSHFKSCIYLHDAGAVAWQAHVHASSGLRCCSKMLVTSQTAWMHSLEHPVAAQGSHQELAASAKQARLRHLHCAVHAGALMDGSNLGHSSWLHGLTLLTGICMARASLSGGHGCSMDLPSLIVLP